MEETKMEEKKVMEAENMAANEEQNKTAGQAGEQQNDQKKENKIIGFAKKHWKKAAGFGAIVGAVGAGVLLDRAGIKLPGKKKSDDPVETED
jgi:hypothetical protein